MRTLFDTTIICGPLAAVLALLALTACGGGGGGADEQVVDTDTTAVTTSYATLAKEAADSPVGIAAAAAPPSASDPVGIGILPPAVLAYCRQTDDWSQCGDKTVIRAEVSGQTREFIVWRPKTAAQRAKVPVVFMLHGTSGDGEKFWNISGWREKALREGFYAVFPSALKHCFEQDETRDNVVNPTVHVVTKWADGQLGTSERPLCGPAQIAALTGAQRNGLALTLADDVAFARTMVAEMQTRFPRTDAKRLFVTGFSNGAAMVGRLAAQMSDVFAAAHCASSVVPTQVSDVVVATRPISILHSMGDEDEEQKPALGYEVGTIPLTESLMQNPRYRLGVVAPFLNVLQKTDPYVYASTLVSGVQTSSFTYATNARANGGNNFFRTTLIQGATHEYPNGRNHPVIMANELWPFFSANPLP